VGGISRERGIVECVRALDRLPAGLRARLQLAGMLRSPDLEQALAAEPGWRAVDYRGLLPYSQVPALLASSRVGVVTLHPVPNHLDALPVKLFEYMDAGLPVVVSDFPLWRAIVEEAG